MIEVIEQINAVSRRVGRRTLEAGEAHSLIISPVHTAPIDDVWDACTNPARIPCWFVPVTGDLRPGGSYQIEGNASGTIERCDPPKGFTATWEFGGQTSWIEVRLASEPAGGTRLELEHIATPGAGRGTSARGLWAWAGIWASWGWPLTWRQGSSVDPRASAAWMISGAGREFIMLSSRGWRGADVAAGTEKTAAEAAADRTLTAYTAAPGEG